MTPFLARSLCFRFTSLSLIKKRITERCSYFVHVRSGAAIFKPALWWRSACLHYTATYRILFIALVTCLPTYRTMARYFEFLSQFYGFHLTHLCTLSSFQCLPINGFLAVIKQLQQIELLLLLLYIMRVYHKSCIIQTSYVQQAKALLMK
jgi:hypothetical protein